VVKVIWHKVAWSPHTDLSVVFSRWRQCAPHLIHGSQGQPEYTYETAFRSVWLLCRIHRRESLYFTLGRPFPLNIAPFHGGSGPVCDISTLVLISFGMCYVWLHTRSYVLYYSVLSWFGGPTESTSQMASRSVQPLLQCSWSWQTDRLRYSVCNNRPHQWCTATRPNNNNYNGLYLLPSHTAIMCMYKITHHTYT